MASEARSTPLVRRDALCAMPLEEKVERRLTRPQIIGGRPQISKQFCPKWMEREILSKISSRMEHEMLTSMDGEKIKGTPKEKNRDWTPKDYSQQGRNPSSSSWTDAGGKSGGTSGHKGGNGKGKSGNQDDSKVNGNPLYAETPANKTFGNNKDTGGRGKGRSNESNPNSNTSNNKGEGGKKDGGGKSFGGRGRGKGVNAVEAGEEWVDEGQVQDVQPNEEEEWQ